MCDSLEPGAYVQNLFQTEEGEFILLARYAQSPCCPAG